MAGITTKKHENMANKDLGTAQSVNSLLRSNSVFCEVGGSVRRITLDNLMNSINSGDEQLLRQVAWGVPLKQNQTSPDWGVVGNSSLWAEYKRRTGRYLLTNDGRAAKLSPTNSGVFADGTALDETKGHVVWIAPNLYYRVEEDSQTGVPVLWMSMIPIGGHRIGNDNGWIVIGAYKGYLDGTKLTSRSGVSPTGAKTINQFWTAARANGNDFGLADYTHQQLFVMLCLSDYGNPNVQAELGYGVGGSQSLDLWSAASKLTTGATKSLGDNSGSIPIELVNGDVTGVNCSRVSLLGLEDLWNWQWEMRQGAYYGSSDNESQDGTEIFVYDGNRLPSSAELASHPSGEYRQLTRVTQTGYTQELILGEYFDIFASKLAGGSNSYWCDYNYNNTAGQLLLCGGYAVAGSLAGLVCVTSLNAFSFSYSSYGARLAYYGKLIFVNGADIS